MAGKKQLGIYWGLNSLYFIDTSSTKVLQSYSLPLPQTIGGGTSLEPGAFNQEALQFATLIQDALKRYKTSPSQVNLSLPINDIIFRSFVIPWMQAGELKGVVDFEASKYVPFPMEQLTYAFHAMNIVKDGNRRMKIIFMAIKKETLDGYLSLLNGAKLQPGLVEPSPLSIIRALTLKGEIPPNQTLAIIEKDEGVGKIIIVDQEVPQFVREFQLRSANVAGDPQALMSRLTSEIKVSFDYFNRQDNQLKIQKLLFLNSSPSEDFVKTLEEDFGIPSKQITTDALLGNNLSTDVTDVNFVTAFGAGIGEANTVVNFNFSSQNTKTAKIKTGLPAINFDPKPLLTTAVICAGLIGLAVFGSTQFVTSPRKILEALSEQVGPAFQDADVSKINDQKSEFENKLNKIKDVRTKSNFSALLTSVPNLLPDGTWLTSFDIFYTSETSKDKKIKIIVELEGYAYLENTNGQFSLVNSIAQNLKNDKDFTQNFEDILLETVRAEKMGVFPVTYFKIKCQ